jgi:hypothetical protein
VHGAVRSNLAAVDAVTGRATSFAPNPDTNFHGDGVAAIAVTATRIYSAGYYEHIGGHVARDSPVALDPRTGHVIAWEPRLPGLVNSFASAGDRVYVAGSFQRLAGIPRNNLGAFAAATGAVYSWNPALSSGQEVYQVALSGARIFAALAGRVIALDTTSAHAVWQTHMRFSGGGVNALAAAGGLVLAGGSFRDAQRVAG